MLKKIQFWSPLLIIASIIFDLITHWADTEYRWIAITAALGWLMYWDVLFDLNKYEKESSTDAQS